MNGPKPLTRQSPWAELDLSPQAKLAITDGDPSVPVRGFARHVGDGMLSAFVAIEPGIGWHLSISFIDHRGRNSRYPRWDEISHARYELLPTELRFVMELPPVDEYVAVHPTCFHLYQQVEAA